MVAAIERRRIGRHTRGVLRLAVVRTGRRSEAVRDAEIQLGARGALRTGPRLCTASRLFARLATGDCGRELAARASAGGGACAKAARAQGDEGVRERVELGASRAARGVGARGKAIRRLLARRILRAGLRLGAAASIDARGAGRRGMQQWAALSHAEGARRGWTAAGRRRGARRAAVRLRAFVKSEDLLAARRGEERQPRRRAREDASPHF